MRLFTTWLEKQLDEEELHECDSKTCLNVLKKQFQTFLYSPSLNSSNKLSSDYEGQVNVFQSVIAARAHREEQLQIKEREVKERRDTEKEVNASVKGGDTDAEGAHISKDASEIDNAVVGASHDKDNINEVQSLNNEMFENVFAHDHDKKRDDFESLVRNVQHANKDNKALKEAKALLTKELEKYKKRVRVFETKPENKNDFQKAYVEANHRAKRFKEQLQT
ncbi:hypothetical protein Tco_1219152 [Tanacetum coccineum]